MHIETISLLELNRRIQVENTAKINFMNELSSKKIVNCIKNLITDIILSFACFELFQFLIDHVVSFLVLFFTFLSSCLSLFCYFVVFNRKVQFRLQFVHQLWLFFRLAHFLDIIVTNHLFEGKRFQTNLIRIILVILLFFNTSNLLLFDRP